MNERVFTQEPMAINGFTFKRRMKRFDTKVLLKVMDFDTFELYQSYYNESYYLLDKERGEMIEVYANEDMNKIENVEHLIGSYHLINDTCHHG